MLLVDSKIQFFLQRDEVLFARVLVKRKLCFIERPTIFRIFHQSQQPFVSWLPELDLEKYPTPLFLVTVLQCFLRFGNEAIAEHCLSLDQLFDNWLELIVLM